MRKLFILILLSITSKSMAQKDDYFYQIPEAPETYTSGHILARLIDGVGFRYYWATYELTDAEMDYKPGNDTRTTLETLQHIEGLTGISRNAFLGEPTDFSTRVLSDNLNDSRANTLNHLKEASLYLRSHELTPNQQKMIFQSSAGSREYPIWNLINGPISDALWHIGQVVSFRRSAGNPFPNGVNVLLGSKKD
ncbi:MAG: hypothetical protein ACI97P_001893 [Arcticibacterium sp.]|jgi:hypothetical protein